jgi:23S rRNA (adenine2503-C2)-methyltransferase
MLKIVHTQGDDDLARVYIAECDDGARIEFVESVQPPHPRHEKWVLIISTLKGCPVGCPICDAGGEYRGKLSFDEIMAQISALIDPRFPDGRIPIPKLKIQFARMGDPALNDEVLSVLRELPNRYEVPGLLPSISTVAPAGCDRFLEELIIVKNELYSGGRFQMQFSLHTTDETARRRLVPVKTWSMARMSAYGERFFSPGDRKITLNFAPAADQPLDPNALAQVFSPEKFLIKLTPINPTYAARKSGLEGLLDPSDPEACDRIVARFTALGYDTLLSIGELQENEIGSNCGMFVTRDKQNLV